MVTNLKKRGNMSQLPTVLIVDDDDVFLAVTVSMVKVIGFPVKTARDGLEAIEVFQEYANDIGCVVLDIQMPRMNGIATFRQLKDIRENVQVIIASGYIDDANRAQLDPLQPVGYLQKPVFFSMLSDLLTKCLQV